MKKKIIIPNKGQKKGLGTFLKSYNFSGAIEDQTSLVGQECKCPHTINLEKPETQSFEMNCSNNFFIL